MPRDKYKLKIAIGDLKELSRVLSTASLHANQNILPGKLLSAMTHELVVKMQKKLYDKRAKYTFSLSESEAICILIVISEYRYDDPFTLSVLDPIKNDLHKRFI